MEPSSGPADPVATPALPLPPPSGPSQAIPLPPSRTPRSSAPPPPRRGVLAQAAPAGRGPRRWWWIVGGVVAAGLAGAFAAAGAFDEQLGVDVGDCVPEEIAPTMDGTKKLDTVPCSEPHTGEVFALVRDRAGDAEPYPGVAEMMRRATQACVDAFPDYVGTTVSRAGMDLMTVWPSPGSWEQEDDRLTMCFLRAVDGLLVGSKRGKAPDRPLPAERSLVTFTVGDCFSSDRLAAGANTVAVELVDCATPHTFEVIATAEAPGDLGYDEIDAFAERSCDRLFESYVGVPYNSSVLSTYWIVPGGEDWDIVENRRFSCLGANDDRDLVGTVRNSSQ